MSGEFRWVNSSYFHDTLLEAAQCSGDGEIHEVSKALSKLYLALAPIERGSAYFEAGDSGSYRPTMEVLRNIAAVKDAVAVLSRLASDAEQLIAAAHRESQQ